MDESFSVPPQASESQETHKSPEAKKSFWRRITRRHAAAVVAGGALIGAGGLIAENKMSGSESGAPEKAVQVWNGGEIFPAGTELISQTGDDTYKVPEGKVLLAQQFPVEYNQANDTRFAKVSFNGKEYLINLSTAGSSGKSPTYVYKGSSPDTDPGASFHVSVKVDSEGKPLTSNPSVHVSEIGQAKELDSQAVSQELEQDGLERIHDATPF